uniref:Uncharacterized protein n=1 Tax=Physcomitrium patens TaxID=3218 RepID=A0A2K1KLA0_PHYPA|nr:hypothetical protein PHYPA_008235 [Physcomitrium patens]
MVTNMEKHAKFHPTIPSEGEKLPSGYVWSRTGFLLHMEVLEVYVDHVVKKEIEHLQKHAVVAYFVGETHTTPPMRNNDSVSHWKRGSVGVLSCLSRMEQVPFLS